MLAQALAGDEVGTRFAPQEQRHSSFELWLKYAKPALGAIVVDAGAARALRDGGASLLPVGVVEVTGDFQEGDAVEVRSSDGVIGKGIANYAASDLRRVMGQQSDERARGAPARGRRGRPPRLLRPGVGRAAG